MIGKRFLREKEEKTMKNCQYNLQLHNKKCSLDKSGRGSGYWYEKNLHLVLTLLPISIAPSIYLQRLLQVFELVYSASYPLLFECRSS